MTPVQISDDPYRLPATKETVHQLPELLRRAVRIQLRAGQIPSELAVRCWLNDAQRHKQKAAGL